MFEVLVERVWKAFTLERAPVVFQKHLMDVLLLVTLSVIDGSVPPSVDVLIVDLVLQEQFHHFSMTFILH